MLNPLLNETLIDSNRITRCQISEHSEIQIQFVNGSMVCELYHLFARRLEEEFLDYPFLIDQCMKANRIKKM